jgi:hypothetical protein
MTISELRTPEYAGMIWWSLMKQELLGQLDKIFGGVRSTWSTSGSDWKCCLNSFRCNQQKTWHSQRMTLGSRSGGVLFTIYTNVIGILRL